MARFRFTLRELLFAVVALAVYLTVAKDCWPKFLEAINLDSLKSPDPQPRWKDYPDRAEFFVLLTFPWAALAWLACKLNPSQNRQPVRPDSANLTNPPQN